MTGRLEIERKARVEDPETLVALLESHGTLERTTDKEDRYYLMGWSPGDPIDFATDPIFRLRVSDARAVLGYKSRTFQGNTEVNEEHEIHMGAPETALDWLEQYLGLTPFVTKHKRTRLFRLAPPLDRASVELNEVRLLGHFLEVEVLCEPQERDHAVRLIDQVFQLLGIPPGAEEPRYYIDMLMDLP